ncbi:MAG: NAD-dependent epimerase/dehydratase family protein [Candidatus Omnitrophica bacterium]|nr:NAD-dependent epimerase/dehydratase family protein [Candidatus Omnitrophota bacterium]
MSNQKILVTGGTGFIGSALVKGLVRSGYKVRVFDNNFRGSNDRLKDVLSSIEIIEGDIRQKEDVLGAVKGCEVVFHLAFINGTKYFYEQPKLVLDVGVKGALNTLEAAMECGVRQYILASSSEVYQQPTHVPTTETERLMIPDPLNPRYSYGGGKLISELLTLNYLRDSGIRHSIFRPHNIFGPQMGFEHVIPEIMRKLYEATDRWNQNSCELQIQGTGEEGRAFCYVGDAVDQVITITEKGLSGQIYHIGMDEEITIQQLVQDIAEALGIKVNIKPGELRQGGTSRRCPSIEKVKSLGYQKKNHYREGLGKTVAWYKQYFLEQQTVNK